ncbi:MAG TPA: hypothetical protein VF495_10090 [Phenylobacterium sp.]
MDSKRLIAWTARAVLLVVFAVALYGAIDPHHNHAAAAPPPDVVEHIGYGYLLTILSIAAAPRLNPWWIGGGILAMATVFEATQALGLVAGTAQWSDLAANVAGVAAALGPFALGWVRRPARVEG